MIYADFEMACRTPGIYPSESWANCSRSVHN